MRKRIVALMLAGMMALSTTACGGSADTSAKAETKTEQTEKSETAETAETEEEVTYQSILDEYTQKIKDATPGLIDEYNAEAAEKAGDVNALAELSNSKIEKLAEISSEGTEKMASLMTKNGDAYETYEEWAMKLNDVIWSRGNKSQMPI